MHAGAELTELGVDVRRAGRSSVRPGVPERHARRLDEHAAPSSSGLARAGLGRGCLRRERAREAERAARVRVEVRVDEADAGVVDRHAERPLRRERRARDVERVEADGDPVHEEHLHALRIEDADAEPGDAVEPQMREALDDDAPGERLAEDRRALGGDDPARDGRVEVDQQRAGDAHDRGRPERDDRAEHAEHAARARTPRARAPSALREGRRVSQRGRARHQKASPMPSEIAMGMPKAKVAGTFSSGGRPPITCAPGIR